MIKTRWKVLPRNQCEGIKKWGIKTILFDPRKLFSFIVNVTFSQVHCWSDHQDKFEPGADGEGEDLPQQAQPHPSVHPQKAIRISNFLQFFSHKQERMINSHPCSYSGSGQRIGRVSSLTSSGPPRLTNRCARTTWWSSSCWARRCSTSAPARWPRPRPSTWRTRCARSSRRWVRELWLCEKEVRSLEHNFIQVFTLCQFVMDNSNNAALVGFKHFPILIE